MFGLPLLQVGTGVKLQRCEKDRDRHLRRFGFTRAGARGGGADDPTAMLSGARLVKFGLNLRNGRQAGFQIPRQGVDQFRLPLGNTQCRLGIHSMIFLME